jgi:hypothetical protein
MIDSSIAGARHREILPLEPRRLWGLWHMLKLNAADFMRLLQVLFESEAEVGSTSGLLPPMMRSVNKTAADTLRNHCDSLNLPVTKKSAMYIEVSKTSEELSTAFLHVKRNMHHELLEQVFFSPDVRYKQYFEDERLFGDRVFQAFPSAANDIFEAGTCLALERGTACVMHLMRVMESGLKALAAHLAVPHQNDWGAYLGKIQAELEKRYKTSGVRSAGEQFFSEAALGFDRVRRAWRNPTMHVDNSYSPERARDILEAVKSFMSHLATQIHE